MNNHQFSRSFLSIILLIPASSHAMLSPMKFYAAQRALMPAALLVAPSSYSTQSKYPPSKTFNQLHASNSFFTQKCQFATYATKRALPPQTTTKLIENFDMVKNFDRFMKTVHDVSSCSEFGYEFIKCVSENPQEATKLVPLVIENFDKLIKAPYPRDLMLLAELAKNPDSAKKLMPLVTQHFNTLISSWCYLDLLKELSRHQHTTPELTTLACNYFNVLITSWHGLAFLEGLVKNPEAAKHLTPLTLRKLPALTQSASGIWFLKKLKNNPQIASALAECA